MNKQYKYEPISFADALRMWADVYERRIHGEDFFPYIKNGNEFALQATVGMGDHDYYRRVEFKPAETFAFIDPNTQLVLRVFDRRTDADAAWEARLDKTGTRVARLREVME